MTALVLPDDYKYTLAGAIVVPFLASFAIGGKVMGARKEFDVQYPNLYAVPGFHKKV